MLDRYSYKVRWSDDDNEFVGLCAEFPSLSWLSKSQDAAFKGIRKLVAETLTDMEQNKELIPEAIATKHFSGKFVVRVLPELHRELALEAREAGVSLNRYVSLKLARLSHVA
jgi:predicted HicB family RNase H-like nuclease